MQKHTGFKDIFDFIESVHYGNDDETDEVFEDENFAEDDPDDDPNISDEEYSKFSQLLDSEQIGPKVNKKLELELYNNLNWIVQQTSLRAKSNAEKYKSLSFLLDNFVRAYSLLVPQKILLEIGDLVANKVVKEGDAKITLDTWKEIRNILEKG